MSHPIIKIDHVAVTVEDLEASSLFYRRVLDAELVRDYEIDGQVMMLQLRIGGAMLSVHQAGHTHPLVARKPMPGSLDLCFRWDGPIETAVERLNAAQVEIVDGPVARHASNGKAAMSVYFRDPDGNLLEFLSTEVGEVSA